MEYQGRGRGGRGGLSNRDRGGGTTSDTLVIEKSQDDSGFTTNIGASDSVPTRGGRGGFSNRGRGGGTTSDTLGFGKPQDENGFNANSGAANDSVPMRGGRGGFSNRGRGGISADSGSGFGQSEPNSNGFQSGNERSGGRGGFSARGRGGAAASGANSVPLAGEQEQNGNAQQTENGEQRQVSRHVPIIRSVPELFKEDEENASYYNEVFEGDNDVAVSGPYGAMRVISDWKEADFHPKLYENIVQHSKYVSPRKIQAKVIPIIADGYDVKGHSETGSGKTAAFMLPIIQSILNMDRTPRSPIEKPAPIAIIVEPTRELCAQVYDQGRKFAHELKVVVQKSFGEFNLGINIMDLRRGCDVLCATPGRLKQLVTQGILVMSDLKYFVLDEADHLMLNNFMEDIREIVQYKDFPPKDQRQTLLFSATFPNEVQALANEMLRKDSIFVSNKKPVAVNLRVDQMFIEVGRYEKLDLLKDICEAAKEEARTKDPVNPSPPLVLVFVETRREADKVALYLSGAGIEATTINGARSQAEREKALAQFIKHHVHVLVSTDVCARGLDIKDLDQVINYDLPQNLMTYVHRIGRTGRVRRGLATSFVDRENGKDANLLPEIKQYLVDCQQKIPGFLDGQDDGVDGTAAEQNGAGKQQSAATENGWGVAEQPVATKVNADGWGNDHQKVLANADADGWGNDQPVAAKVNANGCGKENAVVAVAEEPTDYGWE